MSQAEAAELARCDAEIAEARAELRAGDRDIEGLCLAIHDWSAERRLIESEIEAQ